MIKLCTNEKLLKNEFNENMAIICTVEKRVNKTYVILKIQKYNYSYRTFKRGIMPKCDRVGLR